MDLMNDELFMAHFNEMYGKYDTDNNGYITRDELEVLLRTYGKKVGTEFTARQIALVFEVLDKNNDNKITRGELIRFIL